MRIAILNPLLVVGKVLKWVRVSGPRKRYKSRASIAAFPFSGTEADLSSKLHMTASSFYLSSFKILWGILSSPSNCYY